MTPIKALIVSAIVNKKSAKTRAYLQQFSGLLDTLRYDVELINRIDEIEHPNSYDLIFIRLKELPLETLFEQNYLAVADISKIVLIGLAKQQKDIPKKALIKGIRGVLYENDSLDIQLKGIQQLQSGHLWFSRNIMESTLQGLLSMISSNTANNTRETANSNMHIPLCNNEYQSQMQSLTKREKAIVQLIAQGSQNQEIANQLHISVNTVKTHVYSIFRKTACRNRIALIKWSMFDQNLHLVT